MRIRRLVAAGAVAVLLTAPAGCGGDEPGPAAEQSPGSPVGSPEGGAPESEPPAEEEPEAGYDAAELLEAMKAAVRDRPSTAFTMSMRGGGQEMTGEGVVSYAGKATAMQMTMRSPQLGAGSIEMRLVDNVMFLAMPPMTPAGKFVKVDLDDTGNPMGGLGAMTSGDPLASFDAFDAGLRKVKYLGEEDVDGEPMDHYVLTVNAKKAAKAQGTEVTAGMPKNVTYDLWLDEQDLMRRMQFSVAGVGMTMTMSDWGEPVTVEAPRPRDVVEMPALPAPVG